MLILFDTSVLVASFVESHPQHKNAMKWIRKVNEKEISFITASHALAECYAVLTRLPLTPKILPSIAYHLISENIPKLGKIVSLEGPQYLNILHDLSKLGLSGGIVYDAIILKCAQKAKAQKILTLNPRDFVRLCPEDESFILTA